MAHKDPRVPPVGTVLTRTYKGVEHTVLVTEDGFLYEDVRYATVSGLALKITNVPTNGYMFFSLNDRPAPTPVATECPDCKGSRRFSFKDSFGADAWEPCSACEPSVEPPTPAVEEPVVEATPKETPVPVEEPVAAPVDPVALQEAKVAYVESVLAREKSTLEALKNPPKVYTMAELRAEMYAIAGVTAAEWDNWQGKGAVA